MLINNMRYGPTVSTVLRLLERRFLMPRGLTLASLGIRAIVLSDDGGLTSREDPELHDSTLQQLYLELDAPVKTFWLENRQLMEVSFAKMNENWWIFQPT